MMKYRELLIMLTKMSSEQLEQPVLAWSADYMVHNIQGTIVNGNPAKCECPSCVICDYCDIDDGQVILNFNSNEECHEQKEKG